MYNTMNKGSLDIRKSILFIGISTYDSSYISKILFMKFDESIKLFYPFSISDEIIPYF